MKYQPHVDGLRAVAVLPVVLFHLGLGCPGGYVGVDVFFVISGYLITSLIAKDLAAGKFSMLDFWTRRVRRIVPALAVVVAASLVAGWFLFVPRDLKDLGQSAVAQSFILSNVHFWRESGYFSQSSEVKPLLHTWSLAVEEQFYLLFPLAMSLLWRTSRRLLMPILLGVAAVSFALNVYGSHHWQSATFYLLPARGWELLAGAMVALLPAHPNRSRVLTEALGLIGLTTIAAAVFLYDEKTIFPGVAASLPCIGAVAVIMSGGQSIVGRALSLRPVVFVGLISYSLYLWHWPAIVFTKYWAIDPLTLGAKAAVLVASLCLAALSWRYVETPFRRGTMLRTHRQAFTFAASVVACFASIGLALHLSKGFPLRLPQAAQAYASAVEDRSFLNELTVKDAETGALAALGTDDKALPISLLVWGDSHAMAVAPALDSLCRANGVRGVAATHSSTPPILDYKFGSLYGLREEAPAFNAAVLRFIKQNHIRDVLLVAAWDSYTGFNKPLTKSVASVLSTGARVWIMRQIPAQRWSVPQTLARAVMAGRAPELMGMPTLMWQAESLDANAALSRIAGATLIDPTPPLITGRGKDKFVAVVREGRAVYCDQQHLTTHGAMAISQTFAPIFAKAR